MQAGAHEYLEKPTKPAPFINAVIGTLYASLEWRLRARQPLDGRKRKRGFIAGTAIPRRQGPPPLALHPPSVLARLRYLGCLDATQTLIALRLLWGDSDRQIAQFLGCAERTAKRRVSKVLTRIGAGGRSGVMGALMRDAGFDDSAPPQAARLAVCSTKSRPGSSNQTEA
jgi:DNA-binding NarL/FixJ family response regulator